MIAVTSYSLIFDNKREKNCPVDTCIIKDQTCTNPYATTGDFQIGTLPDFEITLTENVRLGYIHSICYECKVLDDLGEKSFTFPNPIIL